MNSKKLPAFFLTFFLLAAITFTGFTIHEQEMNRLDEKHDKQLMELKDRFNKKIQEVKNKSFRKGYSQGYSSHPNTVKLSTLNSSKEVDKLSTGRHIFQTKNSFSNRTIGRIHLDNNTIKIKENLTRFEAFETCQHELVHSKFPDYRHVENLNRTQDFVYQLEDEFVSPTCLKVVDQLDFKN